MVGGVPDVITCAKFQIEIFKGYDFTGGRIFDFCIDFSMGLTSVQRYCAACDFKNMPLSDAKYLRNGMRYRHILPWNTETHALPKDVISNFFYC